MILQQFNTCEFIGAPRSWCWSVLPAGTAIIDIFNLSQAACTCPGESSWAFGLGFISAQLYHVCFPLHDCLSCIDFLIYPSTVYNADKKEWRFQRMWVILCFLIDTFFNSVCRISTTGASEYKSNKKVITYATYNAALISHNILVPAKTSLCSRVT